MKGKDTFTKQEADEICALIEKKVKADKHEQKIIRDKIRSLGFYSSDFGMGPGYGYTVEDFLNVVKIEMHTYHTDYDNVINFMASITSLADKKVIK